MVLSLDILSVIILGNFSFTHNYCLPETKVYISSSFIHFMILLIKATFHSHICLLWLNYDSASSVNGSIPNYLSLTKPKNTT